MTRHEILTALEAGTLVKAKSDVCPVCGKVFEAAKVAKCTCGGRKEVEQAHPVPNLVAASASPSAADLAPWTVSHGDGYARQPDVAWGF